MHRYRIQLLTFFFLLFLCQSKGTQLKAPPQKENSKSTQYIDQQIRRMMRKNHLPALAISIVDDQKIIYQKAEGLIDIENNIEASTQSVFKLWSVAKVFTAIEIFREMEEGLLDLDSSISEYLPDFTIRNHFSKDKPITVKSLLAHRSGLPRNECAIIQEGDKEKGTLDKFETATSDCFMAYPVGYRYKYSNLGYDLLGRIIEQNRHLGYTPFMKANLLNGLGMKRSTFNSHDIGDLSELAKGYEYYKRQYYPKIQNDINSVPSGNLYSTIEDMSIFLKALLNNELFKSENTREQMFMDHYSRKRDPETMGLGWKTTRIHGTELLVWHDGGPTEGTGALIAILPDQKLGIALMANSTSFSGDKSVQFAIKMLNHIIEEKSNLKYNSTEKPEKIKANKQVLESYAGRYVAFGMIMNVKAKSNKLKGKIGGIGLDLIPVSETEFRVTNWMDKIGLTKIIRPPVDFDKIKIEFHTPEPDDSAFMIINLDHFSYEVCPLYPDHINISDSWTGLVGEYNLAWRLPGNETGKFLGDVYTISMDQQVLKISGAFGPIIPVNDNFLKIVSGPFANETMEYFPESGRLIHQNIVFVPNH